MTVDAYKAHKDIESYKQHLNNAFEIADNVKLQTASIILENQNLKLRLDELKKVEASPYMNFFYSSHDKLSYVLSRLNEDAIDYVETDNGFKAKEYFKKQIRQIEKEFVPSKVNYRDKLRDDIDRIIMQSSQYNDVIDELKKIGYEVRRTNYVSVRPDGSKQFIRLNSLGEEYSMQGIINRINNNVFYQNNISENIYKQTEKKIYVGVLHVAQLYFGAFVDNCLPMKKIRQNEPYSWRNDAELDRLAKINNLVCQGADLDTFRQRYSDSEQAFTELQMKIEALEKQLSIKNAMYKYADIFYGGAKTTEQISAAAQKVMQKNPHINQDNYKSILKMIENDKQELNNLKQQLDVQTDKINETKDQLNTIQKIYAGTYMQSLLRDADIERYADEIPSGLDDEIMSL